MDMTYRVSKNAYIELLADMVRRNDSRPVKLFTTFLLTLGQMAAVAVLCATRLEGRERVFAIVWSLLLAGITLLHRRKRAARQLRRPAPFLPASCGRPGRGARRRALHLLRRHDLRHHSG